MATGSELLRLLEPVVRPGGLPGAARPTSAPIESQSFEQLLDRVRHESRSAEPQDEPSRQGRGPAGADRVFEIENASLWQLMAQRGR